METRTSFKAVLSLMLGGSFVLSVVFIAFTAPFDAPLPYREFRRIISVAPFAGVLLGHIAWREIRSSEGGIGSLRLAMAGLFMGYAGIAFLITTLVHTLTLVR